MNLSRCIKYLVEEKFCHNPLKRIVSISKFLQKLKSSSSHGEHRARGKSHQSHSQSKGHSPGSSANMSSFTRKKTSGTILGFFSKRHQGVYTHHDSFVHLHFLTDLKTETGHVDAIKIAQSDGLQILFAEK